MPSLMRVCVLFQQNLRDTDLMKRRFKHNRVSYVLREAIVLRSIDVYPLVFDLVLPAFDVSLVLDLVLPAFDRF